jgi:shikimate dehydrogenase
VTITAQTQPFAVLGHPIGHSLSPTLHNAAFQSLGLNAVYLAFDVAPDRLMATLAILRELGFGGVNLTIPLKETAFASLTDVDETARRFRAVNTVRFTAGGMQGFNTDGCGILRAWAEAFGIHPRGLDVFILGCGGAGRAVALMCAAEGAARIRLADRTPARADQVTAEIRALAPSLPVSASSLADAPAACRAAQLVVQATSVGLHPGDPSLLPPSAFQPGQWAYDLIYHVPQTAWMAAAAQAGARTANGLGMLLHQGAEAFTLWTGREAPIAVMRRALENALYSGGASPSS